MLGLAPELGLEPCRMLALGAPWGIKTTLPGHGIGAAELVFGLKRAQPASNRTAVAMPIEDKALEESLM